MDNRKKSFLSGILPDYAVTPVACSILVNCIGYFGIKLLQNGIQFHDISIAADFRIPFWPGFIYVYVAAFAQWCIGLITCGRESREFCYRWLSAEQVAKLITFVIFVIYPTTMVRPEITGTGLTALIMRVVYTLDTPVNLFPSIHCLVSWFCFRTAMREQKVSKGYRWFQFFSTIAVFASVVLVKQHRLVDIAGGVLVFELGMLLTRRRNLHRIYEALDRLVLKRIWA